MYHDAVMEDLRVRRKKMAAELGVVPGIEWWYKIDGKLRKRNAYRDSEDRREMEKAVLGDVIFADDTTIISGDKERGKAEQLLIETLGDWDEKVNTGKTERLGVRTVPWTDGQAREPGSLAQVRHIGAFLEERGGNQYETDKKVKAGWGAVGRTAKAWSLGTPGGRGFRKGLKLDIRIKIMKAVVLPTILSFCRSRAWNKFQIEPGGEGG